jgi:KDO2-lipid IV(A) lauroyltransferase
MAFRVLLFLTRAWSRVPVEVAQGVGGAVGWLIDVLPNRERAVAAANIAACFPDMDATERCRLRRRALRHAGKLFAEMPAAWMRPVSSWSPRVDDAGFTEYARGVLAGGKGLIIAAPHLGNWEVGLHQLARIAPVTALYRPPRQSTLEPLLLEGRAAGGAVLMPATARGVKAVREALSRGEIVAILPDQAPKKSGHAAGVYAPFFGMPAYTMTLIPRLARASGAPVLFAFAERLEDGCFRSRWCEAPSDVASDDKEEAAAALNAGVERCVRLCPDQYLWTYKRFFPSPPGVPSIYRRWKKKTRR